MFCKKGVLKNFAKSTGKSLCQKSLFELSCRLRPATILEKRLLVQVFSCEFCELFKNTFCYRTRPAAASVFRNHLVSTNCTEQNIPEGLTVFCFKYLLKHVQSTQKRKKNVQKESAFNLLHG